MPFRIGALLPIVGDLLAFGNTLVLPAIRGAMSSHRAWAISYLIIKPLLHIHPTSHESHVSFSDIEREMGAQDRDYFTGSLSLSCTKISPWHTKPRAIPRGADMAGFL